jgi:hypothetical protein
VAQRQAHPDRTGPELALAATELLAPPTLRPPPHRLPRSVPPRAGPLNPTAAIGAKPQCHFRTPPAGSVVRRWSSLLHTTGCCAESPPGVPLHHGCQAAPQQTVIQSRIHVAPGPSHPERRTPPAGEPPFDTTSPAMSSTRSRLTSLQRACELPPPPADALRLFRAPVTVSPSRIRSARHCLPRLRRGPLPTRIPPHFSRSTHPSPALSSHRPAGSTLDCPYPRAASSTVKTPPCRPLPTTSPMPDLLDESHRFSSCPAHSPLLASAIPTGFPTPRHPVGRHRPREPTAMCVAIA